MQGLVDHARIRFADAGTRCVQRYEQSVEIMGVQDMVEPASRLAGCDTKPPTITAQIIENIARTGIQAFQRGILLAQLDKGFAKCLKHVLTQRVG